MKLREVADELYGLPPEEFIDARNALRAEARTGGDRDLAAAIGRLRKPTTAAWVVNTLARRRPDELAQLVDLGAALREAQEDLDGDELKDLAQQRHRVVAALTRQARALAQELGHPVSDAVAGQVQDTLRAAIAGEEAGRAVLSGHLVSALSHRGLAEARVQGAVAEVGPAGRVPGGARRPRKERTSARRREDRAEALARARPQLAEAETAAADAAADAQASRDRLAGLGTRRDAVRAEVEDLERRLDRAQAEVADLAQEVREAQRRRDAEERRVERARAARDRVRARVGRLAADPGGAAPD